MTSPLPWLPVAERELRVVARRPWTYGSRMMAALVAVGIAGYLFWLFSHFTVSGGTGHQIFFMLAQFSFLYCLFVGVGSTADCLSREKREGTMGLLFLTHLHSHDIVIGKLLATSLNAIYGLMATLPVFAICLLIGGVQPGEFGRMVLALFNAAFFSLSVGLLVSACARQEHRATQTASGVMVLFGFVCPVLGEYLRVKTSAVEWGLFLKSLSPAQTVDFSSIPTAGVKYFWWSLLAVHLLAWTALILACWILPRSWQDKVTGPRPVLWRDRWRQWTLGTPERRRALRLRLLKINPFFWLAARGGAVLSETWLAFGMVVLLAAWSGWFFKGTVPTFVICVITAVILHALLKMQVCAAACERLAEDKHAGALEILLGTPLAVREILRGQWLALTRQFAAPFVAIISTTLVMLVVALQAREPDFIDGPKASLNCWLTFGASSVMLLADIIALGWVGMWQALRAKQVMQARSQGLISILFVPWLFLVLIVTSLAILASMGKGPWMGGMQFIHLLLLWFSFGIATNIWFAFRARRKLYAHFRTLATERFQPARKEWVSRMLASCFGSLRPA
jgi:ABC-type Na+ efflux pump permease subunit